MGCDIHVCCERKTYEGKWVNCDHFKLNPYYNPEDKEEGEREWEIVPIYDNRNYALFATLADVRNYGDVTPIAEPRGLPDDVHPLTKQMSDDWGSDGHSHSYYTLKELMDYMSHAPTITYSGMISEEQADNLDKYNIYPDSWCQWTTIAGFVKRSWTVPDDNVPILIESMKKRCAKENYIFEWQKDYEDRIKKKQIILELYFGLIINS